MGASPMSVQIMLEGMHDRREHKLDALYLRVSSVMSCFKTDHDSYNKHVRYCWRTPMRGSKVCSLGHVFDKTKSCTPQDRTGLLPTADSAPTGFYNETQKERKDRLAAAPSHDDSRPTRETEGTATGAGARSSLFRCQCEEPPEDSESCICDTCGGSIEEDYSAAEWSQIRALEDEGKFLVGIIYEEVSFEEATAKFGKKAKRKSTYVRLKWKGFADVDIVPLSALNDDLRGTNF